MKKIITTIIFSLLMVLQAKPQQYLEREFKGYTNPNELVTLSANLPFSQAIELLSKVSETTTGKKIVSTVNIDKPIGIEINNMPYDKALVVLVQYQDLTYEEKEDVIIVKRKNDTEKRSPETYAPPDVREVKISAVFFELDVNATRQRGIDWQVLLSGKGLDLGGKLVNQGLTNSTTGNTGTGGSGTTSNTSTQSQPNFNLDGTSTFQTGNFFGEATAMFQFFEDENLGEIIASPNVIVRDGNQGRIQVGTDFSVKQRDFAGNVVEKFFPTGTIIEVTPYVYNEDSLNYILLNISVERSSFQASEITTQINKTSASTQIVMLNGEETILGGLFVNEQQKVRTGIPFLKDLPWWFFGIRYLTGSDQTVTTKKELLILIKTDLIPTLKEREENPQANNLIKDELKKNREKIKYYQLNSTNQ